MKTSSMTFSMTAVKSCLLCIARPLLALGLTLSTCIAVSAADTGKTFATPEEAGAALAAAAGASDFDALRLIFGPAAGALENPDRVQATNEHRAFVAAYNQTNRIVRETDSRCVLELGDSLWPFAVPIVKQGGRWFFDTEAGEAEVHNRRIGKNELSALQSVRAYVEAQREYALKDRDGDEVLEYAQKFRSEDGKKDGLYWSPELEGELSPLGPLVAQAQDEGYGWKSRKEGSTPEPFHGYYFKILTRQGKSAPGGKYDYLINGNMIGGFALVAWPAEYGESGIMTLIVNQQGRVYQRDLGKDTARLAGKLTAYDPAPGWGLSPD